MFQGVLFNHWPMLLEYALHRFGHILLRQSIFHGTYEISLSLLGGRSKFILPVEFLANQYNCCQVSSVCFWTSLFFVHCPGNLTWLPKKGGFWTKEFHNVLLLNLFILGIYTWNRSRCNQKPISLPTNKFATIFNHPFTKPPTYMATQLLTRKPQGSRCFTCPKRPWENGFLLLQKFCDQVLHQFKFGSVELVYPILCVSTWFSGFRTINNWHRPS